MPLKLSPRSDWKNGVLDKRKGVEARQGTVIIVPEEVSIREDKKRGEFYFKVYRKAHGMLCLPKHEGNFRVYCSANIKSGDALVIKEVYKGGCNCELFKLKEEEEVAARSVTKIFNASKELAI